MSVRSVLTRTWITQHTCFGTHEPDLTFFLSSLLLLLVPLLSSFLFLCLFLFPSFILRSSFHFISFLQAMPNSKNSSFSTYTSMMRVTSTHRPYAKVRQKGIYLDDQTTNTVFRRTCLTSSPHCSSSFHLSTTVLRCFGHIQIHSLPKRQQRAWQT